MTDVHSQLRYLLSSGRIRQAVELLNSSADFRFTALFRFNAGMLDNLMLVDRDRAIDGPMDTVPIGESYCEFIRASAQPFVVRNSASDDRVAGHPKQPVVRSYVGVPLLDGDGSPLGTICHFDYDAVEINAGAMALMQVIGSYLSSDNMFEMRRLAATRELDRLQHMLPMIRDGSASDAESAATFDMYAGPVRELAEGLRADDAAAIGRCLQDLRETLSRSPGQVAPH